MLRKTNQDSHYVVFIFFFPFPRSNFSQDLRRQIQRDPAESLSHLQQDGGDNINKCGVRFSLSVSRSPSLLAASGWSGLLSPGERLDCLVVLFLHLGMDQPLSYPNFLIQVPLLGPP